MYNTKDPFNTSQIQISKPAVKQNVKFVKKLIGKNVKLSAVVKGNAYGHGIEQMVEIFESFKLTHLSVFSAHEAFRVCQVKHPNTQVMIMGWLNDDQISWAIENDVEFYVFDIDRLSEAIKRAKEIGKKAKIHLEVETGMNRTGLEEKYFPDAIKMMSENLEHLIFEGMCTHYAGAESISNYLRIKDQIELFGRYLEEFKKHDLVPNIKHTACSAAVVSYPETQMDMVRVGILLYGFWPSRETFIHYLRSNGFNEKGKEKSSDPLKRVISWKSKIMSLKDLPMGEFVGYGTSYQAPKKMKIATVPVGYAYGFSRSLSNQGRVIVNGKRVAVIGTVNMNLMIINVSECKEVKKGDVVTIIGAQGKVKVTVASFGEMSNLLNYELLSRLPMDIPREVVD
ncbi:alanine racemase [Marivirga sp. S37H4]|uniref:Alanine racemase n=1 Tax=Marivirga aurantiaca TaxID=2802615 RepID=A0A934X0T1_9BACT|nr:alanine racemase [Marivirga aurantiaca]MBK6266804.1 alanine racemase [Marivirga aurantiaca]